MTYVIGISHRGINSILADQRITHTVSGELSGENTAIKIGKLFSSCVFGATGNVASFNDFLLSAKYQCSSTENPHTNWDEFLKFVDFYCPPTSKDEQFQLLLSHSNGNDLQWFIYDSSHGLTEVKGTVLTLGSGKDYLDLYIEQYFDIFISQMDAILDEERYSSFRQELPSYLFAYYFTQLYSATYQPLLERIGVGGVFTFISQTSTTEFFQKPSLYLLGLYDKNRKHISIWSHHLWFEDNWLVVESTLPPDHVTPSDKLVTLSLFSNDLMQPPSPDGVWDVNLLAATIKAQVFNSAYLRPEPYFQKIGHCDPIANPQSGFTIGYGAPPIINDKGQLLENVLVWLGING